MRYFFIYLSIFICLSCKEETPWRIEELCRQADQKLLFSDRIDSLLNLSKNLTPLEHYAFSYHVQRICYISKDTQKTELIERYKQKFRELPFPIVKNKEAGFLLMKQYAYGGIPPEEVDLEMLSKLLFDMGTRFHFTPEEKARYLNLKSGVYIYFFKEYDTGFSIANEAWNFARKNGLTGNHLFEIYKMQSKCCTHFQKWDKTLELAHELLDSTKNYQIDSTIRQKLYTDLFSNYYRLKDYNNAYDYLKKSEKSSMYLTIVAEILLGCNLDSEALEYLEEQEKNLSLRFKDSPMPLRIHLGHIAWMRAHVYQHRGDSGRYERYLKEAISHFDLMPNSYAQDGALSEAYARWLWTHGKRQEAISRMELLSKRLVNLEYDIVDMRGVMSSRFKRFELLADYYMETGRSAAACHQLKLCDSLKDIYTGALLKDEQRKRSNRVYVEELRHTLEIRTIKFLQERQKMLFTTFLLGCAVIFSIVLGWLYLRRKKELNVIYAIQKKNEQIESAFLEIEAVKNLDDLPADKQLYLRLQKQMYEQKLFLKPDFSRNDLCRLAGSNRMYVSTSINKYAGMNLNLWINKARINHAISLIHAGETKLQTLADSSGFSSSSAFFRNFKQFTLLTPTQYIEREKKSISSEKNKATESLFS